MTCLLLSASHVPFLRHEYITAWWQGLGGGEWSKGELYVVTARARAGRADRDCPTLPDG